MFRTVMSNNNNTPPLSEGACFSPDHARVHDFSSLNSILIQTNLPHHHHHHQQQQQEPQPPPTLKIKKKRNLPGNPDPEAEVIALSPRTLLATNRFVCEICNKGFQRDQNLQLHRRGHNLPWKLKQRNSKEIRKKVYVCPEPSCVHHHPSRALGDLTGIKKHFCRKHGEKKWKCDKCSKTYAVQSDWKAHSKTCGTREYRCDCGTVFSRKDSFITHRAFCDALAEESARLSANSLLNNPINLSQLQSFNDLKHQNPSPLLFPLSGGRRHLVLSTPPAAAISSWNNPPQNINSGQAHINVKPENQPSFHQEMLPPTTHKEPFMTSLPHLSATALLQKAAAMGAQPAGHVPSALSQFNLGAGHHVGTTRDFLGLTTDGSEGNAEVNVSLNGRDLLSFAGGVEFPAYDRVGLGQPPLRHHGFSFPEPNSEAWENY